jgi:hypothetical protein
MYTKEKLPSALQCGLMESNATAVQIEDSPIAPTGTELQPCVACHLTEPSSSTLLTLISLPQYQ